MWIVAIRANEEVTVSSQMSLMVITREDNYIKFGIMESDEGNMCVTPHLHQAECVSLCEA